MKNFNLNNLNSPDYEFLFGEKRMVKFGIPEDGKKPAPEAEPKKEEAGIYGKDEEGAKVEVKKQTAADIARAKIEIGAQQKRNQLKEKLKKIEAKVKGPQDKKNPVTKKDAEDAGKISEVADKLGDEELSAQAAEMYATVNQKINDEGILSPEELNKASKHEKKENLKGLNFAAIAIRLRENPSVNPDRWTAFSAGELETVKKEWQILGIYKENPFYRNIFYQLSKCYDPSFFKGDEAKDKLQNYRFAFQNPTQTKYDLDPEFQAALSFYNYIKLETLKRVEGKTNIDESNQKKDDDPVFTRAKHVVQDNINKFKEAIQNKDYTTAGIYVLGCYAAFKLYKGMDEKSKGDYKKYFFWAAAIYTGHVFAKNAGFNIAKKLGLESIDSELKGTPFASLYKLDVLDKKVEIDNNLFKGISIVKVSELYNKYQESNSQSPNFIDPNYFPWATGEKFGHLTYRDIMKTTPLSREEQKYKQAGHQLYILTQAFEKAYMKTIGRDSPTVSFAQALKMPALKNWTVTDLMNEFSRYALNRGDKSLFSDNISKEMNSRINEIEKGKDIGFDALSLNKNGDYETTAMGGFPVVLRRSADDKAIYVFAKKDYDKDNKLSNTSVALASIPLTGNADNAMKDLRDGITDNMRELMNPLVFDNGKKAEAPEFDGSKWTAKVTLAATPKYDLKEEVVDAVIEPREDGKGVFVTLARGSRINVNESLSKQAPVGFRMIQRVLDTAEFKALRAFSYVDRLKFAEKDPKNPNDKGFSLLIGKKNLELKFKYVPEQQAQKGKKAQKARIELDGKDQEKSLLKNPSFAKEYVDALQADKDFYFNKTVAKLSEAMQYAPQNYWQHIKQTVTGQVGASPAKGMLDIFSGSVPNYFSNTVLDVVKYSTYQRLMRSTPNAKDLKAVGELEQNTIYDANANLDRLYKIIISEGKNMENWDRDKFMTQIVDPMRMSGTKSATYATEMYELEFKVYEQLNGVLDNADFRKNSHAKAATLLKVFANHTSYLDNCTYKSVKIDLDNLKYPPKATPGVNALEDPKLQGFYILNYFEYVKGAVLNKAGQFERQNKNYLPDPSSSTWEINSFENWKQETKNALPRDPEDAMPKYKHKPSNPRFSPQGKPNDAPTFTDLEQAIFIGFAKVYNFLKVKFGAQLNMIHIRSYLYEQQNLPQQTQADIGILRVLRDAKTGQYTGEIFKWADNISQAQKRSDQIEEIENLIKNNLIDYIFVNKDKCFVPIIGDKEREEILNTLKDPNFITKFVRKTTKFVKKIFKR